MSNNKRKFVGSNEFKALVKDGGPDAVEDVGVKKFLHIDEIVEVKEPGQENVLQFTISTPAVDRDSDTISVDGWELGDYMKNPVVLFGHDYRSPPVGKSIVTWIEGNKLKSKASFTPKDLYEFGYMIFQMYKQGFMNAVSVGFMPLEYAFDEERKFGVNFIRQSLMEYSAVPVPSNPEALIEARSAGIDTAPLVKWAEETLDKYQESGSGILLPKDDIEAIRKSANGDSVSVLIDIWPENTELELDVDKFAEVSEKLIEDDESSTHDEEKDDPVSLSKDIDDEEKNIIDDEEKNIIDKSAISYRSAHPDGTPVSPEDTPWDGSAERSAAEVADLKVMSSWVDSEKPDNKGSYKLHHHKASGNHSLVLRGVNAAMGALLGARGGVDIPESDRKGVYNHLAKHLKDDFDREPPEFRFIEAQVLRTMPDDYRYDEETGVLERVSDAEKARAKRIEFLKAKFDEMVDKDGSDLDQIESILNGKTPDGIIVSEESSNSELEIDGDIFAEKSFEGDNENVLEIEDADMGSVKEAISSAISGVLKSQTGKLD